MISNETSNFKELLFKYGEKNQDAIFNKIKEFEQNFNKKTSIDKIDYTNFNKALSEAIIIMEHQDIILSFVQQLSITIRKKMELSKKQMELDKFKITKEVENLELIGELSTKTEKQLIIKREIEERMFKKTSEYEQIKMDYEFSKWFVDDATRSRDLSYAYYQAIKMIIPKN
jgi:putative peptidase M, neutral zinc metallopeptidase, zinc-binding site